MYVYFLQGFTKIVPVMPLRLLIPWAERKL